MTGNYTEEMDAVKKDLKTLKADLSKLTESVSSDAKANARDLRDKTAQKFDEAKSSAVKAGTESRNKAEQAIKDNPIVGVVATAVLGLIAGALLTRR